jgi:N-acyl amino acid synthase of PEP-CTERM/exosortase system
MVKTNENNKSVALMMQANLEFRPSLKNAKVPTTCDLIQLSPLHRFGRYFDVESGLSHKNSASKCEDIYRLRHKVYCESLGYEKVRSNGVEKDKFDIRSQHVAITHQKLGDVVGCTRVVNCYNETEKLPVEILAKNQILDSEYNPENFSRDSICEISRLAVDKEFKQNLDEVSAQEQALYPYLALYLYYSSLKLAAESNRPHVFLLSESRLIRSMRLVGINIIPIGDYVAHKGLRKPCYINAQEFIDNLPRKFLPMSHNEYGRNSRCENKVELTVVNA